MLDGEEMLQIACGELRWDRASWTETKPWKSFAESFARRERDSMLDGQESAEIACGELCWDGKEMLQIACGELRWEGAIQHAGRRKLWK